MKQNNTQRTSGQFIQKPESARGFKLFLSLLLIAMIGSGQTMFAQTNPTAQSLPYTQNFSTLTGSITSYPAGMQGWTVGGSLSTTLATASPSTDQTLAGGTNTAVTAGVFDMVGKMGMLSTGSNIKAICLAVNTTSLTSILVSYTGGTQAQALGGRINELNLQYRIGTAGTFTTVSGSAYSNNASSTINSGTASSNTSTITVTLPTACENVANLQLRWIYRDVSGSGSRPSFSIDDISVTSASTPSITGAATATAFTTTYGTASTAQSFSISGSGLSANIVATTPTGFQVSRDGSTFQDTVQFAQSSGSASGTLYIRLKATASVTGSYNSQNIVLSSTGASSVNIVTASSGNAVTAKALTITGVTADNKVYDGTTSATLTGSAAYSGLVAGETYTVTGTASASFTGGAVGNGKTVSVTGYTAPTSNYSLTQPTLTANITEKALTISGLIANNKVFDGNTTATLTGTAALSGVITADASNVTLGGTPTATFASSAIGTGIAITVTGYTISGSASGNYSLTQPSFTADITSTPSPGITSTLNASATYGVASSTYSITASNTPTSYNATGLPAGLSVNTFTGEITGTPTSVGTYTVSISATNGGGTGAASLIYIVNPKTLTVTGATASSKTYDASNAASITGSTLIGIVGSDVVTINGTGTFASANVGSTIAVTSTQTLGGVNASNYTLTVPTGLTADITTKSLTISGLTANNKMFDGNTTATLSGTPALVGVIAADAANVTLGGSYSASFASSAIGTGIAVTVNGYSISGSASANYALSQPTGLTASITPGPTTLAVGDISIIGFNSNAPDNFAFVTWVDINDNTIIKFTDNAFLAATSATAASNGRGGEAFVIWKNNTGATIPAGTVIKIEDNTPTSTTSNGTIISGTLSGLSSGGDNIFAYQGTATSGANPDWSSNNNPANFTGNILFGLYAQGLSSVTSWLTTGTASSNTSYLPSELNVSNGNIALASSASRGQYTGSRSNQPSFSNYKSRVTNPSNWTIGSSTGVATLDLTSFTLGTTPTISTTGTLSALSTTYGTASSETSFNVSGASMSAGILVTPPAGYEVSLTSGGTFTSTVTVGAAGTISSTPVYVRLASTTTPGSYSGNIVLSSAEATSENVATVSSSVSAKQLTVSGATASNKVYDATNTAAITGSSLVGIVGSDVVTINGTGTFASANSGTGIVVTSTQALGGANASNYTLAQPSGLSANITSKSLTISGLTANNKVYNGTTTASLTGTASLVGVITADTSNVTLGGSYTATFASASVGTGIAITVSGYSISGSAAGNYALTQPTGLTANITFALNASVNQSISCYGFNNGSIDAVATPAGPSYTFSIDGGASTNTTGFFENITPGTHTICASDGNTTVCQSVVMTEPDALTVSLATSSTVSCLGNDGALTATITGGTNSIQPYLTTWSNGLNVDSLYALSATGLSATTYTITVEDDRQCFATATAAVGTAAAVSVTASNTSIVCLGGTSTITTSASGGTGAKTTSISGGSFTVNAGTYTITATDTKGCTGTTVITINQPAQITNSSSVTACNSYAFNGTTYTTSGVYTHTFTNANSCDSIYTLNLTVNYSSTNGSSSATSCDSYTWNGATYTTSGSYTYTTTNASACVNTATLTLTINNNSTSSSSATACDTYTWACNGVAYTTSGNYTCTSNNAAGCVNTATLNLTINNSSTSSSSATACDSYTWACNGVSYTTSGNYTCTSNNAAGCVNTATLNLTINNSSTSSPSATACDSYTWSCNGVTYTTSGNYTCTSNNAAGCVNTATLNLTINNSSTSTPSATACDSYTWTCNNVTYTNSGSYTCTSLNASGCVNTATLGLTINRSTSSSSSESACGTYTWNCNNATYTVSGNYTCTSLNNAGCVHTATLNLTINSNSSSTLLSATACDSYTWACNGVTYTTSGNYTCTSMNALGCLNTATLDLTINASSTSSSSATACNTYTWHGTSYTTSGVYTYTSLNAVACTNTATLNLTINYSSTNGNATQTACDSYTWNAATYNTSGVYTFTSLNAASCVNTATLNLTINASSTNGNATQTSCNSYPWNGTTYTASGVYTYTSLNNVNCTNTATLNLTVNYSSTNGDTTKTVCNSYTWNGTTYTTSGVYTYTSLNNVNCTNTATLNLTVNYSSTNGNESQTACNSYSWNGASYTTSGVYTYTSLNNAGCTNTATLNLAVNYSSTNGNATQTACDSYTWNGSTYNTSGVYTLTTLNAASCVNTATLNLTINASSTNGNASQTACNSYLWNGTTYTTSGVYTFTSLNNAGCTNTATLTLTVNYSSTNGNATQTSCDSYTWNGSTYNTSGSYTYTTLNNAGCTNTATLTLVINYSSTNGNATQTACNSYSWNGASYTASGVYTYTELNNAGCTNTATLNLTVNYSSTNGDTTKTVCNSYTWNGTSYTTSGVYTYTNLNALGCTNTATLNLTVNYSSTNGNESQTACDSYSWNGLTYNTSGVYTFTTLNAASCVNTATLTLSINYSSTNGNLTTSACDSYTWNSSTYTASGTYTYTSLNASNCTNTATLILTMNASSSSSATNTSYVSYTWASNSVTYTASGTYTATSLNASGCVHTSTLNLTVLSGISLAAKVILSGAYNVATGLMHDSLRVNNLIPTTEPYSSAPFLKPQVGGAGLETVSEQTLAVTGNDAIVDWVFVELRSSSNSTSILATKRALLQRDGDIVNADGTSPLFFSGIAGGNYYVSIKHRNHLGVMSAAAQALAYAPTTVDFTSTSFAVYTNAAIANAPRRTQGGVATLWPGDANNNKNVKYNGLSNDKEAVLQTVGAGSVNNIASGYRTEDVNLDGKVKYNSTDNDRSVIGAQVGVINPNIILSQHTPN